MQVSGELFAKQGFYGTTLRHITNSVGCNGAAVNYHFHSKNNLYIAIQTLYKTFN
ncbi:MAG: helix-turn-helix transcriptional regulator [Sedimentisphaerales bacterium]|nr:helix-turn-helix transcriptional regulator [Sedimentisphaerales bacterium]